MDQEKICLLQENIERVIRGKGEVVKMVIVTLIGRGHLLIEDVPGVGKTTLAQTLARSISCSFKRIQFTSDLLPSDIVGVSVYNPQLHEFEFKAGPIFTNILLADEINRTTPKTQSSLLEAMNDSQVTVENRTYPLPQPFMVIATQNPIEYQGTYPLPESQLDRFMMRVRVGYPAEADEKKIMMSQESARASEDVSPVLSGEEVVQLQQKAASVRVDESLIDYLLAIVTATRHNPFLTLGVSTRGGLFLRRAAQALAFIEGRDYCLPDDIKRLAPLVFSHRIIISSTSFGQKGEDAEKIIQDILDEVPVPL